MPQYLNSHESDTFRIIIDRNLAVLETHQPECAENKAPIEAARLDLVRLSDVLRLIAEDREQIEKTVLRLKKLGVPVVETMYR